MYHKIKIESFKESILQNLCYNITKYKAVNLLSSTLNVRN